MAADELISSTTTLYFASLENSHVMHTNVTLSLLVQICYISTTAVFWFASSTYVEPINDSKPELRSVGRVEVLVW